MQFDLRECYRILEVEPDASLDEVKRAYRELVKVWHPDRFFHDLKLQQKAQEKLKQINAAYERICAGGPMSQATGSNTPSGSGTATQRKSAPPPRRPAPAPAQESSWKRRFVQAVIAIVVIAVLRAVFSTKDNSPAHSVETQPSYSEPRTYQAPRPPRVDVQPKVRQHLGIAQISELHQEALRRQPSLGLTLQEFSRYAQEGLPDYDFSEGINYSSPKETPAPQAASSIATATPHQKPAVEKLAPIQPQASPLVPLSSPTVAGSSTAESDSAVSRAPNESPQIVERRDFFTVGSTKEEVLVLQGTPTAFTPSRFDYGYSSVDFVRDQVISWSQSPANPLRAKLLPSRPVEVKGYFTVDSTKDEVLAIQGTPTEFTGSVFTYGYSRVFFVGDKVKSWEQSPANPLKAKLLPATAVVSKGYFTVDSTKDEVLAVQGTPTEFTSSVFTYGYSRVLFVGDKVKSWEQSPANPLRAKLLPSRPVASRGYLGVGSTKDEVLAVQGTPTEFTDSAFTYGYSRINFQNGRVISWEISPANPLNVKLEK